MDNNILDLSIEEKEIVKIIFSDKYIPSAKIKNLNYERIIKIVSSHLIIPLFYCKIKEKKIINLFPKDFTDFLNEIYVINRNRNEILVDEIKSLSELMTKNKIKHVFLKGSAMLINDFYNDIGERMIGDIDILIEENKINNVKKFFENQNYFELKDYNFFESEKRHLNRRINKTKIFAVEPHTRLTNYKGYFNTNEIFDRMCIKKKTPNALDMLKHNIYNWQINDEGAIKLNYSYRNYYDTFIIMNKNQKGLNDINSIISSYFFIYNKIIPHNNSCLKKIKPSFAFKLKFKLSSIFKFYLLIYYFFKKNKSNLNKTKMLLINKNYRVYIFRKYRKNIKF